MNYYSYSTRFSRRSLSSSLSLSSSSPISLLSWEKLRRSVINTNNNVLVRMSSSTSYKDDWYTTNIKNRKNKIIIDRTKNGCNSSLSSRNKGTTTTTTNVFTGRSLSSLSTVLTTPSSSSSPNISKEFTSKSHNYNHHHHHHGKNIEVSNLVQSLQHVLDIHYQLHQHQLNPEEEEQRSIDYDELKQIKNWHFDLNKAIKKRDTKLSIALLNNMPSSMTFISNNQIRNHYLSQEGEYNQLSFLFNMMQKMIKLFESTRFDLSFQTFLKSEELYQIFKKEIMLSCDDDDDDDDDDSETNIVLDKLNYLRGNILIQICSSLQYAKSTNEDKPLFTRTNFTDMIQELISIIQYDIQENPLLQHTLYPILMKSISKQTFSNTNGISQSESLLWDIALSSLKDELEIVSQNDQNGINNNDVDNNNKFDDGVHNHYSSDDEYNDDVQYEEQNIIISSDFEKNQFTKHDEWMKVLHGYGGILKLSTFRKQENLPFVDLLDVLIKNGYVPKPVFVLNILQNEYPYTNKKRVSALLEATIHLQKVEPDMNYLISPVTLEHMTHTASKKGQPDIVMLVWDYLTLIQETLESKNDPLAAIYSKTTPGLYENAALAFAGSYKDHLVFVGILSEMENDGIKPSRSFLSRLAQSIRVRPNSVKRLDNVMYVIKESYRNNDTNVDDGQSSVKPTTSALNTVLAGFSDFGFSAKAIDIYHDFEQLQCIPDENTFSFLIDSIAMDITTAIPPSIRHFRRPPKRSIKDEEMKSWLSTQVDTADIIYEAAVEMGHGSNEYVLNSYIKILCAIGELDKALFLLEEKLEKEEKISIEALGLLALSNAHHGEFDIVQDIIMMCRKAGYKSGLSKHVTDRIAALKIEYDMM